MVKYFCLSIGAWPVSAGKLLLLVLLAPTLAFADEPSITLKISAGATFQGRNDVQIPNDDDGTRFALDDIAGSGPWPAVRFEGIWNINERHGLRILIAPLSFNETGNANEQIRFAGASFNTNQPVQAEYTFNSYRLGYRYHLRARENWDLWIGGTLKVRDAEIKLTQGAVNASDDNIGFVPLLHIAWEYRFSDSWSVAADIDALAGGPGRAIDFGFGLNYSISNHWRGGLEYRVLEGGADTDSVFNFALFQSALLTIQYRL